MMPNDYYLDYMTMMDKLRLALENQRDPTINTPGVGGNSLYSPEMQGNAKNQALLAAGLSLLGQQGYSRMPQSFMQQIGNAGGAGLNTYNEKLAADQKALAENFVNTRNAAESGYYKKHGDVAGATAMMKGAEEGWKMSPWYLEQQKQVAAAQHPPKDKGEEEWRYINSARGILYDAEKAVASQLLPGYSRKGLTLNPDGTMMPPINMTPQEFEQWKREYKQGILDYVMPFSKGINNPAFNSIISAKIKAIDGMRPGQPANPNPLPAPGPSLGGMDSTYNMGGLGNQTQDPEAITRNVPSISNSYGNEFEGTNIPGTTAPRPNSWTPQKAPLQKKIMYDKQGKPHTLESRTGRPDDWWEEGTAP